MIAPDNTKKEPCRECGGKLSAILPDALCCGIAPCAHCNNTGVEPKDRKNECSYCEGSGKDKSDTFAGPYADGLCPWCRGTGDKPGIQNWIKRRQIKMPWYIPPVALILGLAITLVILVAAFNWSGDPTRTETAHSWWLCIEGGELNVYTADRHLVSTGGISGVGIFFHEPRGLFQNQIVSKKINQGGLKWQNYS